MKQIVIAQRGWVFVGDVTRTENEVVIEDAAVVRRWGTTAGLGQLAAKGQQRKPDWTRARRCGFTRSLSLRRWIARNGRSSPD